MFPLPAVKKISYQGQTCVTERNDCGAISEGSYLCKRSSPVNAVDHIDVDIGKSFSKSEKLKQPSDS